MASVRTKLGAALLLVLSFSSVALQFQNMTRPAALSSLVDAEGRSRKAISDGDQKTLPQGDQARQAPTCCTGDEVELSGLREQIAQLKEQLGRFSRFSDRVANVTARHDALFKAVEARTTRKLVSDREPRVLLYVTTHLSADHKRCLELWPGMLDTLGLGDVSLFLYITTDGSDAKNITSLRYDLPPALLRRVVGTLTVSNPGKQDGATQAMLDPRVKPLVSWSDYDWVVRMNPDVRIVNSRRLRPLMHLRGLEAILIDCNCGMRRAQTDFYALRPRVFVDMLGQPLLSWRKNAESELTVQLKRLRVIPDDATAKQEEQGIACEEKCMSALVADDGGRAEPEYRAAWLLNGNDNGFCRAATPDVYHSHDNNHCPQNDSGAWRVRSCDYFNIGSNRMVEVRTAALDTACNRTGFIDEQQYKCVREEIESWYDDSTAPVAQDDFVFTNLLHTAGSQGRGCTT